MPVAPVTSAAPDDTSPGESVEAPSHEAEQAVIEAARGCLHTIGRDKVTMDDVCAAAGISRATLYRIFPGGRDVLFDAVRRHSIEEFFADIRAELEGASSLEDFLVRVIVAASRALREDTELAALLATQPGVALGDLTLDGLDRIIGVATGFITPFTDEFIPASEALVTRDWKFIAWPEFGVEQLFDLRNDPFEERDAAGDPAHRALVEDMRARLEILRRESR